jgi:hypothetical protein
MLARQALLLIEPLASTLPAVELLKNNGGCWDTKLRFAWKSHARAKHWGGTRDISLESK